MSIKRVLGLRRGHTLAEMMVAMAVFSICGLALASVYLFAMKSFVAMGNYVALDRANREAMDAGAKAILSKPYERTTMLSVLEDHLPSGNRVTEEGWRKRAPLCG